MRGLIGHSGVDDDCIVGLIGRTVNDDVVEHELIAQTAHNRLILNVVEPAAIGGLHVGPEANGRSGVHAGSGHAVAASDYFVGDAAIYQIVVPQLFVVGRLDLKRRRW